METTVFLKALLNKKPGLLRDPLSDIPLLTKLEECVCTARLPPPGKVAFLLSSSQALAVALLLVSI